MAQAHKLDCESVSDTCRFIIQSENEEEAVELASKHMRRSTNRSSPKTNCVRTIYRSS